MEPNDQLFSIDDGRQVNLPVRVIMIIAALGAGNNWGGTGLKRAGIKRGNLATRRNRAASSR